MSAQRCHCRHRVGEEKERFKGCGWPLAALCYRAVLDALHRAPNAVTPAAMSPADMTLRSRQIYKSQYKSIGENPPPEKNLSKNTFKDSAGRRLVIFMDRYQGPREVPKIWG